MADFNDEIEVGIAMGSITARIVAIHERVQIERRFTSSLNKYEARELNRSIKKVSKKAFLNFIQEFLDSIQELRNDLEKPLKGRLSYHPKSDFILLGAYKKVLNHRKDSDVLCLGEIIRSLLLEDTENTKTSLVMPLRSLISEHERSICGRYKRGFQKHSKEIIKRLQKQIQEKITKKERLQLLRLFRIKDMKALIVQFSEFLMNCSDSDFDYFKSLSVVNSFKKEYSPVMLLSEMHSRYSRYLRDTDLQRTKNGHKIQVLSKC